MKTKVAKPSQSKEITISVTELEMFWKELTNKFLEVIDTAKKSKITIRLEKQ